MVQQRFNRYLNPNPQDCQKNLLMVCMKTRPSATSAGMLWLRPMQIPRSYTTFSVPR